MKPKTYKELGKNSNARHITVCCRVRPLTAIDQNVDVGGRSIHSTGNIHANRSSDRKGICSSSSSSSSASSPCGPTHHNGIAENRRRATISQRSGCHAAFSRVAANGRPSSLVSEGLDEGTAAMRRIGRRRGRGRWGFNFDDILESECEQEEVYRRCAYDIVDSVLAGVNGTIMAYGSTGAGKTYTMMGKRGGGDEQQGLCSRALHHIFREVKARNRRDDTVFTVQVSFLEIYNEQVYDLLQRTVVGCPSRHPCNITRGSDSGNGNVKGKCQLARKYPSVFKLGDTSSGNMDAPSDLAIYERSDGTTYVKGLHPTMISTEDEAIKALRSAETNRAIAENQFNHASSRSHAVMTVYLTIRRRVVEDIGVEGVESEGDRAYSAKSITTASKLNIVDLAGSEKGGDVALHRQGCFINKSLVFLEQVTIALADETRGHVPFRQSKLTHFLKDSLGGNCRTVLIACVWPRPDQLSQSLATLKFASRMRCVKNNPVVNRGHFSGDEVPSLRRQAAKLKHEAIRLNDDKHQRASSRLRCHTILEEAVRFLCGQEMLTDPMITPVDRSEGDSEEGPTRNRGQATSIRSFNAKNNFPGGREKNTCKDSLVGIAPVQGDLLGQDSTKLVTAESRTTRGKHGADDAIKPALLAPCKMGPLSASSSSLSSHAKPPDFRSNEHAREFVLALRDILWASPAAGAGAGFSLVGKCSNVGTGRGNNNSGDMPNAGGMAQSINIDRPQGMPPSTAATVTIQNAIRDLADVHRNNQHGETVHDARKKNPGRTEELYRPSREQRIRSRSQLAQQDIEGVEAKGLDDYEGQSPRPLVGDNPPNNGPKTPKLRAAPSSRQLISVNNGEGIQPSSVESAGEVLLAPLTTRSSRRCHTGDSNSSAEKPKPEEDDCTDSGCCGDAVSDTSGASSARERRGDEEESGDTTSVGQAFERFKREEGEDSNRRLQQAKTNLKECRWLINDLVAKTNKAKRRIDGAQKMRSDPAPSSKQAEHRWASSNEPEGSGPESHAASEQPSVRIAEGGAGTDPNEDVRHNGKMRELKGWKREYRGLFERLEEAKAKQQRLQRTKNEALAVLAAEFQARREDREDRGDRGVTFPQISTSTAVTCFSRQHSGEILVPQKGSEQSGKKSITDTQELWGVPTRLSCSESRAAPF